MIQAIPAGRRPVTWLGGLAAFGASGIAVAFAVAGWRLLFQARSLIADAQPARPEFAELAMRSAGIALIAAAQIVMVLFALRGFYPYRRGQAMAALAAAIVMAAATVIAVVFGLTGG